MGYKVGANRKLTTLLSKVVPAGGTILPGAPIRFAHFGRRARRPVGMISANIDPSRSSASMWARRHQRHRVMPLSTARLFWPPRWIGASTHQFSMKGKKQVSPARTMKRHLTTGSWRWATAMNLTKISMPQAAAYSA